VPPPPALRLRLSPRSAAARYPGDANDWALPEEVAAHYARLDADGKAALAKADWWKELQNDPDWEPDPNYDHRKVNPMHYVQGCMSPFYIEAMQEVVPDGDKEGKAANRKVWAVWFGPYNSNGGFKVGVAQGGAQSSVFDNMAATVANQPASAKVGGPTASLSVKMLKPGKEIPGLFRADAWVDNIDGRKLTIKMTLTAEDGTVCSEAEALHIGARPKEGLPTLEDVFTQAKL